MSGVDGNKDLFVEQEVIPGMGSLGGSTLRLNDASTVANLAILSVMLGVHTDTDQNTGQNYMKNPQHVGVKKNGHRNPHLTRRQHQENTISD